MSLQLHEYAAKLYKNKNAENAEMLLTYISEYENRFQITKFKIFTSSKLCVYCRLPSCVDAPKTQEMLSWDFQIDERSL